MLCMIPSLLKIYIIDKQLHLLSLCLYIIEGWRNTPVNLIWNLEEPVCKIIYTYHVIRQEN